MYLLIGFCVLVLFLFVLVIPHVRQTKLASSLVNFWAHISIHSIHQYTLID